MVHHTNLEGIPLANGQPVDGDFFVHNVWSRKVNWRLDSNRLIEAPGEQLHVLDVIEVIQIADVVVCSRILGKVWFDHYSV